MSSLKMVTSKHNGNPVYHRSRHQYLELVSGELSKLYGNNKKVVLVPSGMAAISTILHVININYNWGQYNLVYGNELYCDTPRTIKYMSNNYNRGNLFPIDVTNDQEILTLFLDKLDKKLPTVLFIESCSNPSGNIFNFELIQRLKTDNKNIIIIVDNTWVSSAIFNPFQFDIDFVVVSLTKYYGAGSSIGGAIVGRDDNNLMDETQKWVCVMGSHISPSNCSLIYKNMASLQSRIQSSYILTLQVAEFLPGHGVPTTFVGLPEHPSHQRMTQFFGGKGPSVLTFTVNKSKSEVISWLKQEQYFPYETSFGSAYSKLDPWPQHVSKKKTRIRLSIGYQEQLPDLVQRLSQLLNLE